MNQEDKGVTRFILHIGWRTLFKQWLRKPRSRFFVVIEVSDPPSGRFEVVLDDIIGR